MKKENTNDWFRDWFSSKEYLEVYSHRNEEDAQKLIDLIFANVLLKKKSFILDAACGAGRHLLDIASRGYTSFGFDLSMALLKKAKENGLNKSISLNVFCSDIRRVALKQKFDLVLNLFTSFGYFDTDSENFSFVRTAFDLLEKEGTYVLDFFNGKYLVKNLVPESEREIGGKRIIEKRKVVEERVKKEIIIAGKESEETFTESVRLYSKEKIVDEFAKIGFRLDYAFGDYDGNDFDRESSKRLILFFKK